MADAANLRFKIDLSCSHFSVSVSNNKRKEQDSKGKESNTQLPKLRLINRDKLDKHKTNTIKLLITFLSTNVNILFAIFGIFSSLNPDLLTFPTLLTLSSIG
jgi:hypothetical protein